MYSVPLKNYAHKHTKHGASSCIQSPLLLTGPLGLTWLKREWLL
jgi:hypothetical protein